MVDWFLVRPGESIANAEGRLQGRADSPLTARGVEQARRLGAWCRAARITWDRVYSSPLVRARDTAEIVLASGRSRSGGVRLCPELEEISVGRLEGLRWSELEVEFRSRGMKSPLVSGDYSDYGGESAADVQARVEAFVERAAGECAAPDERVLLVAHGGLLRQFLRRLIADTAVGSVAIRTGNCSISTVHVVAVGEALRGELISHMPLEMASVVV